MIRLLTFAKECRWRRTEREQLIDSSSVEFIHTIHTTQHTLNSVLEHPDLTKTLDKTHTKTYQHQHIFSPPPPNALPVNTIHASGFFLVSEMVYFSYFFSGSNTSQRFAGKMCLFLSYHERSMTLPACDSFFSTVWSAVKRTSSWTSKLKRGPLFPRAWRKEKKKKIFSS